MWKSEVWLSSFLCRISYLPPINQTYDYWFCKIYTSYSEIQTLCIWERLLFCGLIGWYLCWIWRKTTCTSWTGATYRLKFFVWIWKVFLGCSIWQFLPKFKGCVPSLKVLRPNLGGFSRVFHLRISSQIFFYYCNIVLNLCKTKVFHPHEFLMMYWKRKRFFAKSHEFIRNPFLSKLLNLLHGDNVCLTWNWFLP